MKKSLWMSICGVVAVINLALADNISHSGHDTQQQAELIYNRCNDNILSVSEESVIAANIADVNRSRLIRKCIKDNIFEQISFFLQSSELESFKQSVNSYENTLSEIYKDLFFCTDHQDEFWCQDRSEDDMSLSKLIFENKLTDEMYLLLIDILDAKNGNLVF